MRFARGDFGLLLRRVGLVGGDFRLPRYIYALLNDFSLQIPQRKSDRACND